MIRYVRIVDQNKNRGYADGIDGYHMVWWIWRVFYWYFLRVSSWAIAACGAAVVCCVADARLMNLAKVPNLAGTILLSLPFMGMEMTNMARCRLVGES